ncbi:hypothetical protein [Enhygromyxa salina]|uniref:Uncharacterized protein n=1 Tax=Enhygromyxa salina TaxID=215803 RepID=A0A2S9XU44_9BACT|nr:hypothetical protein [Enhygromyxa salina]PRP96375.1 hypothetical protein ENSA7_71900 [Enhygromyxa salina]
MGRFEVASNSLDVSLQSLGDAVKSLTNERLIVSASGVHPDSTQVLVEEGGREHVAEHVERVNFLGHGRSSAGWPEATDE